MGKEEEESFHDGGLGIARLKTNLVGEGEESYTPVVCASLD
jgi:hypothetical protein